MKPPNDLVIDHINGNGLDNRRCNLRVCTQSENQQNRFGAFKNNRHGALGVHWNDTHKVWQAEIGIDRRTIRLGRFKSKQDAIDAVREGRKKYLPFSQEALQVKRSVTNDVNEA